MKLERLMTMATHVEADKVFDARTAAGGSVTALGVGMSVKDFAESIQTWAAFAGFVLTLLTIVYVALGIYGRIQALRNGRSDS